MIRHNLSVFKSIVLYEAPIWYKNLGDRNGGKVILPLAQRWLAIRMIRWYRSLFGQIWHWVMRMWEYTVEWMRWRTRNTQFSNRKSRACGHMPMTSFWCMEGRIARDWSRDQTSGQTGDRKLESEVRMRQRSKADKQSYVGNIRAWMLWLISAHDRRRWDGEFQRM